MFRKSLLEILQESDYIGKVNSRILNYTSNKAKDAENKFFDSGNYNIINSFQNKMKKLQPHFNLASKRARDRDINNLKNNYLKNN